MPTAAAKLEKQPSTEAAEPLKMAMIVLEHKIRNLEKRKRKIEIYREDQSKGQTLNSDQLSAVAKYDEVNKTLDFAQELYKQFQGIATDTSKVAKKQLRKEALERAAQEVSKVKEVLMVQDILQGMGQETVREDFLAGRNNAVKLLDEDLKYLDDLYLEVAPKRSAPEDGLPPFVDQLSAAAEHLISIVEGKQKEVVGTTHEYLKKLFTKIQDCGYFDQVVAHEVPVEANQSASEVIHEEVQAVIEPEVKAVAVEVKEKQFSQAPMPAAPLANSLPIPSNLVPHPGKQPQNVPPEPAYFAPPVAVTTATPSQTPDYNSLVLEQQQTVNELINTVGSSFNFLQESELDTPGVDSVAIGTASSGALPVSSIPSQTYTNQNFPAVPKPAPTMAPASAPPQTVGYQVPVSELTQTIPGFATTSPNSPPPIPMPPSHRSHPYSAVQPPAANAYQARPEYHQEQQGSGPSDGREGIHGIHVDSWALSESAISAGNVAAEWNQHGTGQQPEWNADTNQAAEWALAGDDSQGPGRVLSGSSARRGGGRGGGPRGTGMGTGSPTAYNTSRTQGRPGNFHNGNRNNGNYGNYARNQEGHPGAVSNNSYYQQQNGYQAQPHAQQQQQQSHAQQHPHAQNTGQQRGDQRGDQFATNGNYVAYRARPAHRAPGTRGSPRGGMPAEGANANANANANNPRATRGTAFVGGRPHMNRQ